LFWVIFTIVSHVGWIIIDVDPPQAALTIWAFRLLWLFCCPFSAAVAVFAGELAFKPVPKDGTTETVALEVHHTIFLDTFLLLSYVYHYLVGE
jgi:hypothetical protein